MMPKTEDNERDALLRLRYARDHLTEVEPLVRDMAIAEIESLREQLKDAYYAINDASETVCAHIEEYVKVYRDIPEGLKKLRKVRE